MAAPGNEIELLSGGVDQQDKVRKGWSQNLWNIRGDISVRPGWGQIAELDTTLGLGIKKDSSAAQFAAVDFGYEKLLACSQIETSFGHTQIVSLFYTRANSGNVFGENKAFRWDYYLVARIFDVNSRRHWEEVFHRQTSEQSISGEVKSSGAVSAAAIYPSYPSTWHGCYSSSYETDNSTFVAGDNSQKWFFEAYQNTLYFGAPGLGVYCYKPADFQKAKYQQIQTSEEFDWLSGVSESSLIKRLDFSPGVFSDGFVYVENSALSEVVASTSFRNRLVYATKREVFFSDPNRPENVIAINFISCPSSEEITALSEIQGNLVIYTRNEMYLYIPSEGTIISRGRPPVLVSSNVGCINANSVQHFKGGLVWVSSSGVYSTANGTSITEISQQIRSFFNAPGLMTNPMTSYFETAVNGHVDIGTVTPPRTLLELDEDAVTVAYVEGNETILVSVPSINGAWCYSGGMWSWWTMESVANESAGNPVVNTTQNLINPIIISSRDNFFAVCGVNRDTIINSAGMHLDGNATAGVPNSQGSNFVITQLGHGGALDRSSLNEDERLANSFYITVSKSPTVAFSSRLYFRPMYAEETATGFTYYSLIEVVPLTPAALWTGNIVAYTMRFKFDNSVWNCNSNPATAAIPARIPNERLKSATGFTSVSETDAAGVPTHGGGYITISWDGATIAPGTYANQPSLNTTPRIPNPLIELPFTPVNATKSLSGLGILMVSSSFTDSAGNTDSDLPTVAWVGTVVGSGDKHINNAKAQPVDWAYKSHHVANPGKQLRARGIYARMQSTGPGSTKIVPNWAWGIYNVLLGSDDKEYTTQIVDYDDDIQTSQDKLTVRSRFRTSAGDMAGRLFGTGATTPKWGNPAIAAEGDYLIDDAQTDTIATSDSVKGETISYMVFGFIRNRAASVSLQSLRGVFRMAGGRRRTGR